MGTPEFAVPSLKILSSSHHKVLSVVTVPDKKQGRGQKITQSDVKKIAIENNIPVLQPEKLKDAEFVSKIRDLKPDLIVVVAFRILPKEIYTIPNYGSINLHASLLPKYRGAAPINWAIINGDKETGVTTFFLQDKVDTGNVIMQKSCFILDSDDAGTLHDKLSILGAETVLETVKLIDDANGKPNIIKQNDSEATPAPKIFKPDCFINSNKKAVEVFNFIRGLSPYPASHLVLNDKLVKIFKSVLTSIRSDYPGKLFEDNGGVYLGCNDFLLQVTELQPEGRKRMSDLEFLNGYREYLG